MSADFVESLAVWFVSSEAQEFEYRQSDFRVVLKKQSVGLPGSVDFPSDVCEALPLATDVGSAVVRAPATGRVLFRHPLESVDQIREGAKIVSGDVVAFLQIGEVLSGITAQESGVCREPLVEEGKVVGFGERLLAIQ